MSGAVKQAKEVGAGDDTSFFFFLFFIFRFYVMLFILLLLIFTKIISLLSYLFIFIMKIPFSFSCSGMFRVPGFIDAPTIRSSKHRRQILSKLLLSAALKLYHWITSNRGLFCMSMRDR